MTEPLVRLRRATTMVRGNHTVAQTSSDDEILRRAGYQDQREYWRDATSTPMSAAEFVRLLETWLLDPERAATEIRGRAVNISMEIGSALRTAVKAQAPWLICQGDSLDGVTVRCPIDATRWMLGTIYRDLVPPGLREYIKHLDAVGSPSETPPAPEVTRLSVEPEAATDITPSRRLQYLPHVKNFIIQRQTIAHLSEKEWAISIEGAADVARRKGKPWPPLPKRRALAAQIGKILSELEGRRAANNG